MQHNTSGFLKWFFTASLLLIGGIHAGTAMAATLASISVQPLGLQSGYPGMKTTQTVNVLAMDTSGNPLAGVSVQITGDVSGGWAFPSQATTAADGSAKFTWVPGSIGSGMLTVSAAFGGLTKSTSIPTQSANPPTLPLSALNLFAYHSGVASGYSVDLTPLTDPSGTYYAALVWAGGYAGIQRDGSLYHDQLQFSVWNNSAGQASIVSLGSGVTCVPFGGEGTGQACSLNYPWSTNVTYWFVMDSVPVAGGLQVSMTVTNLATGVSTFVGKLFQPTPAAMNYINTFVEQFSRVAPNCLDQPLRAYSIKNLMAKVNGIWTGITSGVLARQGDYSTICSNVQASTDATGLTIQIGQRSMSDPYNPQNTYNIPNVNQASQTITFGAAPTVVAGGTGTVTATATSGLAVTYTSATPGVCTVSGSTVTGIAAGTCTIAADQAGDATYSAALQVTQSITVTTGSVTTTISPTSASANASGLTGTISVTANSGSAWTATSSDIWLTVSSGSSGSGNGTVVYSVAANTGTSARTGTLTIAGQTFSVTQAGASSTFTGTRSEYQITQNGGSYTVTDLTAGRDGTRTLTSADHLAFSDMTVNLTVQAKAASIAAADLQRLQELYVAFFKRVPAADGLAYWIDQFKAGSTLSQIADSFYAAGVANASLTGFSSTMSNDDFVHVIYRNVLGRPEGAGASGLAYWSGEIESKRETRGSLVASILNSAHSFKGDATYGWVADLLDNKVAVANQFSVTLGLTYNTPEASISNGMAIAAAVTSTSTAAALALIGVGQ